MPSLLNPIPLKTPIVQPKSGAINVFFRQAWETLRAAVAAVSTVGAGVDLTNQGAALANVLIYTTPQAGLYRVTYYLRKTVADGVSSSAQFVWHWTESGLPQTLADAALTTDTTGAVASESRLLQVDQAINISCDVNYASNTPAKMKFRLSVRVEQMN